MGPPALGSPPSEFPGALGAELPPPPYLLLWAFSAPLVSVIPVVGPTHVSVTCSPCPQEHLSSHSGALVYTPRFSRQAHEVSWVPSVQGSPEPARHAPPPHPAHVSCVYLHVWAPWFPWPTGPLASSRHMYVCGSLLCKCHTPSRDTWALTLVCARGVHRGPCSHSAVSLQ